MQLKNPVAIKRSLKNKNENFYAEKNSLVYSHRKLRDSFKPRNIYFTCKFRGKNGDFSLFILQNIYRLVTHDKQH